MNKNKTIDKNKNKEEYKRPLITYSEKLSKEQIRQLLIDYEEIKNINEFNKIDSGTHLRYFENKDDELKFRTGGILTVKTGLPDYIILSNGKLSWSVQVKDCIFFRRVTSKDIKEEYEGELIKLKGENRGLQLIINEINKEKNDLIKKYNDLIKKYNIIK